MQTPSQDKVQACTTCGQIKPLCDFYNRSRAGGEIRPWKECKRCVSDGKKSSRRATCTVCGKRKLRSEFYKRYGKGEGHLYAYQCKSCVKKRRIELYWLDPEGFRAKNVAYGQRTRATIKDAVFEHYGGYRCVCCGETEKSFLTLDHKNNDGADFRRKLVGSQARGGGYVTYRFLYHHGYIEGFQVLCANCQHGKRMNDGICPHQVRCNDQEKSVESSDSKRSAPVIQ